MTFAPLKLQPSVTAPGAVENAKKVSNDIRLPSREALQRQLGLDLLGSAGSSKMAPSAPLDEHVFLSAGALAIGSIKDNQPGVARKILGAEPLLSHLQPPVASLLAAALDRAVASSGLFYESHLLQYLAGTRTLVQLMQEPQANIQLTAEPLISESLSGLPVAEVTADKLVFGRAGSAMVPIVAMLPAETPEQSPQAVESSSTEKPSDVQTPLPSGPDGKLGAITMNSSAAGTTVPAKPSAIAQAGYLDIAYDLGRSGDTAQTVGGDFSRQDFALETKSAEAMTTPTFADSVNAVIHPDAMALVRQQLELLAVPIFRWGGELAPGAPLDWEIWDETSENQTADGDQVQATGWTTRLVITLPTLRTVELRLNLAGSSLKVHLAAGESNTVDLLNKARHQLPLRFGAVGLELSVVEIDALMTAPGSLGNRQ